MATCNEVTFLVVNLMTLEVSLKLVPLKLPKNLGAMIFDLAKEAHRNISDPKQNDNGF